MKNRIYNIALIVSLLLHILLILLYRPLANVTGLFNVTDASAEEEPLVFEFAEPAQQPNELVETPENARVDQPQQDAQFLSDKNARTQDQNMANLPQGQAFSEGQTDYKFFQGGGPAGESGQETEQPSQETLDNQQANPQPDQQNDSEFDERSGTYELYDQQRRPQRQFSKELLRGNRNQPSNSPNSFSDDVNWDNQDTSADALGGVSLSTYEWEYGPYILYMKRRLREHLFPPSAFYQLGAISGEVKVYFAVQRNGEVRDVRVMGNTGHESLISTSLNSVKASNPFRPLPDHFPDKQLELTWTFIYSTFR